MFGSLAVTLPAAFPPHQERGRPRPQSVEARRFRILLSQKTFSARQNKDAARLLLQQAGALAFPSLFQQLPCEHLLPAQRRVETIPANGQIDDEDEDRALRIPG